MQISRCTLHVKPQIRSRRVSIIRNLVCTGGNGNNDDDLSKKSMIYRNFIAKQVQTLNKSMMISSYEDITQNDFEKTVFNKFNTYHHISLEQKENHVILFIFGSTSDTPESVYEEIVEALNKKKIGNRFLQYINNIQKLTKLTTFPIVVRIPTSENLDRSEWDLGN